jgi:hypothetical protein
MAIISRVLVGLIGLASFFSASQHWFALKSIAVERGIEAVGTAGRANVRADIGGIFLAIGAFALLAAWKQSRTWALAALTVITLAFVGRVLSLMIDGSGPGVVPPLILEAVIIAIFAWAAILWKKMPEGL